MLSLIIMANHHLPVTGIRERTNQFREKSHTKACPKHKTWTIYRGLKKKSPINFFLVCFQFYFPTVPTSERLGSRWGERIEKTTRDQLPLPAAKKKQTKNPLGNTRNLRSSPSPKISKPKKCRRSLCSVRWWSKMYSQTDGSPHHYQDSRMPWGPNSTEMLV